MKSKNIVSLSVAFVFLVLGVTGLLIYFGQGTHAVEHTHAWFGILFVSAAVFHIVNNWPSLSNYTKDRKTGGIRREFVVVGLLTIVFAVGVSADMPGFAGLANAGKKLFRGDEPRRDRLSQTAIDSIARTSEATYSRAFNTTDTTLLPTVLSEQAMIWDGGNQVSNTPGEPTHGKPATYSVEKAELIDNNVILVHGSRANPATAERTIFTHILKKRGYRMASGGRSTGQHEVAIRVPGVIESLRTYAIANEPVSNGLTGSFVWVKTGLRERVFDA